MECHKKFKTFDCPPQSILFATQCSPTIQHTHNRGAHTGAEFRQTTTSYNFYYVYSFTGGTLSYRGTPRYEGGQARQHHGLCFGTRAYIASSPYVRDVKIRQKSKFFVVRVEPVCMMYLSDDDDGNNKCHHYIIFVTARALHLRTFLCY